MLDIYFTDKGGKVDSKKKQKKKKDKGGKVAICLVQSFVANT